MSWLGLERKIAIVTGGALGIGKACCRGLAEVGVRVAIADVNEEAGAKTLDELKKDFGGDHLTGLMANLLDL